MNNKTQIFQKVYLIVSCCIYVFTFAWLAFSQRMTPNNIPFAFCDWKLIFSLVLILIIPMIIVGIVMIIKKKNSMSTIVCLSIMSFVCIIVIVVFSTGIVRNQSIKYNTPNEITSIVSEKLSVQIPDDTIHASYKEKSIIKKEEISLYWIELNEEQNKQIEKQIDNEWINIYENLGESTLHIYDKRANYEKYIIEPSTNSKYKYNIFGILYDKEDARILIIDKYVLQ